MHLRACTVCINYILSKKDINYTFFSKFILLQLTGSYFCSVTGYGLLASFPALADIEIFAISAADILLIQYISTSLHFRLICDRVCENQPCHVSTHRSSHFSTLLCQLNILCNKMKLTSNM